SYTRAAFAVRKLKGRLRALSRDQRVSDQRTFLGIITPEVNHRAQRNRGRSSKFFHGGCLDDLYSRILREFAQRRQLSSAGTPGAPRCFKDSRSPATFLI